MEGVSYSHLRDFRVETKGVCYLILGNYISDILCHYEVLIWACDFNLSSFGLSLIGFYPFETVYHFGSISFQSLSLKGHQQLVFALWRFCVLASLSITMDQGKVVRMLLKSG